MRFSDRKHAALLLAERLSEFRRERPLVLAIPRGGVPMGRIIADELRGDIDLALVRKLGSPRNEEYAVGAVDEDGQVVLNDVALGFSDRIHLENEIRMQMDILRERRERYVAAHDRLSPAGRTVIVVDDGVATGATMQAALHAIRVKHPARLIAAVSVAPPDAVQRLEEAADEVVSLLTPSWFMAVSQFFGSFPQVSDEEVRRALKKDAQMAH